MDRPEALRRLGEARFARLATVRPEGGPHLVPITFALTTELVVTVVDHKPKSTQRLQRIRNIEHEPQVSVLVDHTDADWSRLWWVRIDGRATVHPSADDAWLAALADKYPDYRAEPPRGPAIAITIETVRWWASSDHPTSS